MSGKAQGLDELALLLGRHAPEHVVGHGGLLEGLRRRERRGVDPLVSVGDARLGGDARDRPGIIAGDHVERDALVDEVRNRLGRARADVVGKRKDA